MGTFTVAVLGNIVKVIWSGICVYDKDKYKRDSGYDIWYTVCKFYIESPIYLLFVKK